MEQVSVYVTAPDEDTAKRIARALLEQRLVACANLVPAQSLYWWNGRIEESREVAMFLKTTRSRVVDLVRAVEEMHPDEVPCVVTSPIEGGAKPYLAWIEKESSGARQA